MFQSKTATCEDFFYSFLKLTVINVFSYLSEFRYNYGSKGCTMDLLSKNAANNNKIKFTTGVRNLKGRDLSNCLEEGRTLDKSYNNT